jgi:hypothetical protein
LQDIIDRTQAWAQMLGPNLYLQAAVIAAVFIVAGKIADFVISRLIGNVVRRSRTDFDDNLISLLHRPVFISFVLVGLALATLRLQLPAKSACTGMKSGSGRGFLATLQFFTDRTEIGARGCPGFFISLRCFRRRITGFR